MRVQSAFKLLLISAVEMMSNVFRQVLAPLGKSVQLWS